MQWQLDKRRLSFGRVAELYDLARPSYPAALVDDVLAFEGGRGVRALEVGAGTGKATVRFAARGVAIRALEPDAGMAAVARRNCAEFSEVTVENTDFEGWEVQPAAFDLVYSAQAWHWVAPELKYVRARQALRDGGVLAAFWNRARWERTKLREDLTEAYRRAAPEFGPAPGPMHPSAELGPDRWEDWEQEIGSASGFEAPEVRWYDWTTDYSAAEYVRLLGTHSDHMVLPDDRRAELMRAIAGVIEAHGGTLRMNYRTKLCLARAGR